MSDELDSLPAGAEGVVSYETADNSPLTVEEAARSLYDARNKAVAKINNPAESAETATAETELAQADAESPETETVSEDQVDEPAKPAIDPPKSWTKDLHDHWATLDPVLQERIVTRDREDQAAIKRSFNDAADARKAAEAVQAQAEQARQQYEAKLPAVMQTLLNQNNEQFSDINSMADVESLAREAQRLWPIDPFAAGELSAKLNAWQVHQQKMANTRAELDQAEGRKAQEHSTEWAMHVQKENTLAAEFIPELADKVKGPALTQRVATELLPELGFKDSELADLANGKTKLSIYDHRIQRLLADGLKLRDIQGATKAVAAKSLPPVQRPGTSKPSGSGAAAQIQTLEKQLSSASGDKAARISAEIWRLEKKTRSA